MCLSVSLSLCPHGFYHEQQSVSALDSGINSGFMLTVDTVTVAQTWQQQDGLHLLKVLPFSL